MPATSPSSIGSGASILGRNIIDDEAELLSSTGLGGADDSAEIGSSDKRLDVRVCLGGVCSLIGFFPFLGLCCLTCATSPEDLRTGVPGGGVSATGDILLKLSNCASSMTVTEGIDVGDLLPLTFAFVDEDPRRLAA